MLTAKIHEGRIEPDATDSRYLGRADRASVAVAAERTRGRFGKAADGAAQSRRGGVR